MNVTTFAEVFPVGEHIAEELEARGWTQIEFAEILGRPAQFVSEVIAGKKEITRESAAQIGAAFGTSPELWLNLQDAYHLWRQRQDVRTQSELEEVRLRARLKELAPVSVLKKRGFLKESSTRGQATEIQHLYDMEDIYGEPGIRLAARRSNGQDELTATQMAWVACVRKRATSIQVGLYSKDRLIELAKQLPHILADPAQFQTLAARFAAAGVRLVYVEAFPSSKLDGCSFMMDDTPVIGISGRGRRLDKVLFTLLHEVAHIILGHLVNRELILDDQDVQQTLGHEGPADEQACEWLLPNGLPQLPERIGIDWVERLAVKLGVHPIVIIGRLQKTGRLTWRTALAKGAPTVTDQLSAW